MTAEELLARLDRAGIRLRAEAGRLHYDAPVGALTTDLREAIKAHRSDLLERLALPESRAESGAEPWAESRPDTSPAPLSFPQQGLWLLEQLEPGHPAASEQFALGLAGPLDVAALARAWNHLLARHDVLRTRFVSRESDGEPRPVVAPADPHDPVALLPVTVVADGAALCRAAEQALATPFDAARGPLIRPQLFRRGPGDHLLLVTAHHGVADGLSVPVLHRELAALYAEAVTRQPAMLPAVTLQYEDFARAQRARRPDEGALQRWRERLRDLPPPALEAFVRPAGSGRDRGRSSRVPVTVPPSLAADVRRFARAAGATPYGVLLAAFRALLVRLGGSPDLVIGTPMTLRDRPDLREAVGCFVNPVALRTTVRLEASFRDLVLAERATVLAALEDRHVPFAEVVAAVGPERRPGEHPLFQILFTLEADPVGTCAAGGLRFSRESIPARRAAWFGLELALTETGEGGDLAGHLAWQEALLEADVAHALPGRWLTLLAAALAAPDAPLATLPLMTAAERIQVLEDWNATSTDYPDTATLHGLVLARAAATPAAPALLAAADPGQVLLRYGELAQLSGALAARLQALGVAPGTPVGLALPRSAELVVAWLAVLRAGAVAVPLDPGYPAARLQFIAADAGLGLVLTGPTGDGPVPPGIPRLAVRLEALAPEVPGIDGRGIDADTGPDDPLCILYTSGSTGRPKGAVQCHRGAVNRCTWMWRAFGFASDERFALRTSPNFVDSLWEIFGALIHGIPLVVIPDDVATDPLALPGVLERAGVTHLVLVPALLRALLESGGAPRLRGLRRCISSGEPLDPALARALVEALPELQLLNTYGTSEVWDATAHAVSPADGDAPRVPIGRPIANARVYVLDARGEPVSPGIPGELVVGGIGVGPGYWRQPALTSERFGATGPGGSPGPCYRTGDRGRWRTDGVLECLGRLDGQLKLRGHRLEPGEIEAALQAHAAVAAAAVTLVQPAAGEPWLLAGVTLRPGATGDAQALKHHLREHLPGVMVPAVILLLPKLPLTPSGKVDRRGLGALATRSPVPAAPGGGAPPRPGLEAVIAGAWRGVLHRDAIGRDENFFDLGGHSLVASRLVHRLRQSLGVELSLADFFRHPTIAALAETLQGRGVGEGSRPAIRPAPGPAPGPSPDMSRGDLLSFGQERLWFLDQLDPASPAYNIAWTVDLAGPLDRELLRRALAFLLARHGPLRAAFPGEGGRPRVVTAPSGPVNLEDAGTVDAGDLEPLLVARARAPFCLATGPLVRFVLAGTGDDRHVLLVVCHHIVSDATSNHVLFRELAEAYGELAAGRTPALPALPLDYADYAAWQRTRPWPADHLAWWQQRLAGAPQALELPTDRPRPAEQKFRGAWVRRQLDGGTAAALRALGRDHGASLYPVLLAAFQALLHRWSGSTDILTGTPVEGRPFAGAEALVGLFINTVVIRTALDGDPAFGDLLAQVRDRALEAQARQALPFEQLVEALAPERSLSRAPVFQVMFNLVRLPRREQVVATAAGPLVMTLDRLLDSGVSSFDLTLTAAEEAHAIGLVFEYDTDLFDGDTVEALADQYEALLQAALAAPAAPLSQLWRHSAGRSRLGIDSLAGESRAELLPQPVAAEVAPAGSAAGLTVLDAIRGWVTATPGAVAVAVEGEGESLTYQALWARAGGLAARLARQGIGPGDRVGISLPRSPAFLVAVLGVLRSGAAYVPLDPDYPEARRRFMAEDAGLALVLEDLGDSSPRLQAERTPQPADPAYLVYTSGSTGEPRGVVVTHGNLAALGAAWRSTYGLEPGEAHLQMASAAFDVFAGDWVRALTSGGRLVLCPRDTLLEPAGLHRLLTDREIRVAEFVPAVLRELLGHLERTGGRLEGLRLVVVGSDTWSIPEYRALRARCRPDARVINSYGLAEATVDSTWFETADEALLERLGTGPVPIGRPFPGVVAEVRDAAGEPVPAGVPGELWIGGAGVAAGYHRRPALTAARFATDDQGIRWYRTGDAARLRADGLLELRGRLDDQLKLRGFRLEPGEIEAVLRTVPGVADGAVLLGKDPSGESRLVAWVAGPRVPPAEVLRARLAERLPAHAVPAAFGLLPALPRSPNGKVDRRALASRPVPAAVGAGRDDAPASPREARLAALFAGVLGVDRVGRREDFFARGGHSLLATRLAARIRDEFQVELPLQVLFESPTVAGVADWLAGRPGEGGPLTPAAQPVALHPGPRSGDPAGQAFPLSLAQQRLWFLEQLEPGTATWHLHGALRLSGPPDPVALGRAVDALLERQETLRTVFGERDGTGYQRVLPARAFAGRILDVLPGQPALADEARLQDLAQRPFDLGAGPLWRVVLTPSTATTGAEDGGWLLLVVIHHLLADGWSLGVLFRELSEFYAAAVAETGDRPRAAPERLPIQYADWATWQQARMPETELQRQLDYWQQRLAGAPPVLELHGARPDGDRAGSQGAWLSRLLAPELAAALRRRAAEQGCTLYTLLLAAFALLLGRYAGQEDVVVGTPVAGRRHSVLEGLIGCFVNTLPLRTDLRGNPTVAELLARVKAGTVGAWEHQDLPFEKLVEVLNPARSRRHSPVVQVQLAFHNQPRESLVLAGLAAEPVVLVNDAVKFDLSAHLAEEPGGLRLGLGYREALFDAAWAGRFADHFEALLRDFAAGPATTPVALLGLPPRPPAPMPSPVPAGGCSLAAAFGVRAAATPGALAVMDSGGGWSYGELARQAGAVQGALRAAGVQPGDRVGLWCVHGREQAALILGVLAAGAAYVPLDAQAPPARRALQIRAAGIRVVVSDGRADDAWVEPRWLNSGWVDSGQVDHPSGDARPAGEPVVLIRLPDLAPRALEPVAVPADGLAYILYTSGTTGQPKGVPQTHRNVREHVDAWAATLDLKPSDRLSLLSTAGYDAAVQDLFGAWLAGASVHPLDLRAASAGELRAALVRQRVTVLHATPTVFRHLFAEAGAGASDREGFPDLRLVVLGGEAATRSDLALARRRLPGVRFANGYGLTEATAVLQWQAPAAGPSEEEPVPAGLLPVGFPVGRTRVELRDETGREATVTGEVVIRGPVTPGYWGEAGPGARGIAGPDGDFATGDLARRLPDGALLWTGRRDDRVKLRGQRLELAEVEAVLMGCPGVTRAVARVVAQEATQETVHEAVRADGEVLVAAVTGTVDGDVVREHARRWLPAWAVPAQVRVLDAMPSLPNGKVDRQAVAAILASIRAARLEVPTAAGAPAPLTATGETLAALWQELLPRAVLAGNTDFFAAGGHSLLAMALVARVRDRFGVELPLVRIFEAPTLEALARVIEATQAGGGGSGAPPASSGGPIRRRARRPEPHP